MKSFEESHQSLATHRGCKMVGSGFKAKRRDEQGGSNVTPEKSTLLHGREL